MNGEERPKPRAFRLGDSNVLVSKGETVASDEFRKAGGAVVTPADDAFAAGKHDPADPRDEQAIEMAQKRGLLSNALVSWSGLFWSTLGALVSFAIGLWVTRIVDDLFSYSKALGLIGLVLALLFVASIIGLLAREIRSIMRQRGIARLHVALAQAREADDRNAARKGVAELVSIYAGRPDTAGARKIIADVRREIIDGRDLIDIAERNLMAPLDDTARREIATAARRVSMVTAISPRAIVDVLFVAAQAVRLIRRIAEIYGGRPGVLGFVQLARSVGAHLAITAGVAIGDSLVQQVVGHGIAARLSAKLGEGVLNGMLTTRIGLSAMAVCRPLPFVALKQPAVKDVAPFLLGDDKR
jgi:putative membrane protein